MGRPRWGRVATGLTHVVYDVVIEIGPTRPGNPVIVVVQNRVVMDEVATPATLRPVDLDGVVVTEVDVVVRDDATLAVAQVDGPAIPAGLGARVVGLDVQHLIASRPSVSNGAVVGVADEQIPLAAQFTVDGDPVQHDDAVLEVARFRHAPIGIHVPVDNDLAVVVRVLPREDGHGRSVGPSLPDGQRLLVGLGRGPARDGEGVPGRDRPPVHRRERRPRIRPRRSVVGSAGRVVHVERRLGQRGRGTHQERKCDDQWSHVPALDNTSAPT